MSKYLITSDLLFKLEKGMPMELLDFKNLPIPSILEDRWKGTPSKKCKPAFQRENLSEQHVDVIVQFFSSNYIPPRLPQKGGVK